MIKNIYFLSLLSFLSQLHDINAFNLCVVGASSGLGKELLYQGIDRDLNILALTSSTEPFTEPCRVNSFTERKNQAIFSHPKIFRDNYWKDISKYNYQHLIITTGAQPFEVDYSDKLTNKLLENLSKECQSITLISAYGVGESLDNSNQGIKIMNKWYLKDVYRAKNEQEKLVNKYNDKIKKYIYRPNALSYGETLIDSISRKDLASEILDTIQPRPKKT